MESLHSPHFFFWGGGGVTDVTSLYQTWRFLGLDQTMNQLCKLGHLTGHLTASYILEESPSPHEGTICHHLHVRAPFTDFLLLLLSC